MEPLGYITLTIFHTTCLGIDWPLSPDQNRWSTEHGKCLSTKLLSGELTCPWVFVTWRPGKSEMFKGILATPPKKKNYPYQQQGFDKGLLTTKFPLIRPY